MDLLSAIKLTEKPEQENGDFPEDDQAPEWAPDSVQDPPPGQPPKRATRKAAAPPAAPPKVTPKLRKEAAEEIQVWLELLALGWSTSAPPCGEALSDSSEAIAAKVANLLARNPKLFAKFHGAGLISDIVQTVLVMKPVLVAAYGWYVTKEEREGGDGGGVDVSRFGTWDPAGGTGNPRIA